MGMYNTQRAFETRTDIKSVIVDSLTLTELLDKRKETILELEEVNNELGKFISAIGGISILIEQKPTVNLSGFLKEDWDSNIKLDYLVADLKIKMNILNKLL